MAQITIDIRDLEAILRRVVREELAQIIAQEPNVFYLAPDSPLYEDMQAILQRKAQDKIKLHTHAEVWGE
ncbi:MAG: hypothetical protein Q8M58_10205 [Anaerolineales bacterium]|nr:hypothetical protein [Anaerolineales bacterium]